MRRLLIQSIVSVVLLAVLVWSCSTSVSLENGEFILINQTEKTVTYSVIESQTLNHIDLMWKSRVTSGQENLLRPTESDTILPDDIVVLDQYKPAEDLEINLWEVIDDSAFHRTSLDLSMEDLEKQDFQVTIHQETGGDFDIGSEEEQLKPDS